jgi:hypothetical protein
MSEVQAKADVRQATEQAAHEKSAPAKKLPWETPKLEDVSEQVMAQPYIRFT